jgi:hypothetical protein
MRAGTAYWRGKVTGMQVAAGKKAVDFSVAVVYNYAHYGEVAEWPKAAVC